MTMRRSIKITKRRLNEIVYNSIKDIISESTNYKIGFLDNEIITVTVYNRYLGGEKCVGATCVKDNRHESAVKLLKLIIEHNVTNWNKWIWIEASGKVEAFCREANAFNVPTEFVSLYLEAIPFEPIENDKYHYKRKIKGSIETKTIFGFRDRLSFELLKEKLNKEVSDFLKKVENKMNESEESLLDLYLQKKHPAFRHKAIVDYFVYLKDDEQCDEFTPQMLNTLQKSIDALEGYLKNDNIDKDDAEIIEIAIDEGNRVLNTVNPLIPIKIQE